jgi:predicted transcriptional regulator
MRKIEVDEATAGALEDAALARGVSVSEVVADLVSSDLESDEQTLAELDRRWKASQAGNATVPHEVVVEWLKSWGTPEFRPRRSR